MQRIEYIDRRTGKREEEKIYGRWALSLLYGETVFSRLFSFFFLPLLVRVPWFSRMYGLLQKNPSSQKKIAPFIAAFAIDPTEFVEKNFASFNDFFIRKLKKESRPIDPDPKRLVFPADGRYLAFQNIQNSDGFYVKGQRFCLLSLLGEKALAERFEQGSMLVARLCPTDYHRFHFPSKGVPKKARPVEGLLFSVNPVALRQRLSILWENKRTVTEIHTDDFGSLLYIEVGATCVGSIHQTYLPETTVEKGSEKGFFSFGGSCVILLFEPGCIQFDADLIHHSKRGLETMAFFGSSFGAKIEKKNQ